MRQSAGGNGSGICRAAAFIVLAAVAPARAAAQGAAPPRPVFSEDFAYDAAKPAALLDKWRISGGLDKALWDARVAVVADPGDKTVGGRTVARIMVEDGDALDPPNEGTNPPPYVCDAAGSRAAGMEAEPGGVAPSERAEIQVKADRKTGAGEIVKFGETVWYRFSFKAAADWPHDQPMAGREACRTVIHQIKQNASKDGVDCGASPFFKIEARPFGDGVRFFAQVVSGAACAAPPVVSRTRLCVTDLPRGRWASVNVRLLPAQDTSGRADVWLNGAHCGAYRGAMGDPEYGRRRNGAAFIDVQPRFGIYRDRRAETQTIYFDKIRFWNTEPVGNPDWSVAPLPQ
jgi:hypothetical protein